MTTEAANATFPASGTCRNLKSGKVYTFQNWSRLERVIIDGSSSTPTYTKFYKNWEIIG